MLKMQKRTLTKHTTYDSLVTDEFRDIDFGDKSKSLSDRYRNDSLLVGGKFASTRPEPGLDPSSGLLPGDVPFSTSKLKDKTLKYCKILF